MRIKFVTAVIFSLWLISGYAGNDSTKNILAVNQWLTAGPVTVKPPLFSELKNVKGESFNNARLLKHQTKAIEKPVAEKVFLKINDKDFPWIKRPDFNGFATTDTTHLQKGWQAAYLFTDRFLEVTIEVKSKQCFELWVDGEKKTALYQPADKGKDAISKKATLHLERGKHLLVIKSLYNPEKEKKWEISTEITFSNDYPETAVQLSVDPATFMDIHHLMDGTRLEYVSASYNGKYLLFKYKKIFPPEGKTESWFEIREKETNRKIYSSQYANVYQVKWTPVDNSISFIAEEAGKSKLFLLNVSTFEKQKLLDDTKNLSYYRWSPQGDFIIYSITEKPAKDKDGVIHVVNPMDRWPWWRSRGQLFQCRVSDGATRRLTYGYLNNSLQDIRPDGRKLLFSQSVPDFSKRPYTKQILMEMDLETMTVDTVWVQNFGGDVQYSPDGKQLLVNGSAAMFNGAGVSLPKKYIPNDYDTQSYIYDLETKQVTPLTKEFDPSVQSARWLKDNTILFKMEEKSWNKLYRYDIAQKHFTDLHAQVDMVTLFDLPENTENFLVYTGNSMQYPNTAWTCTLNGKDHRKIDDPEKDFFRDVVFGKTENWSFKNKKGRTIEGRVYYPPDYDENKKYPVIVYYYGGTSPTGRSFRGRYPKNLFAAQGYIVYVLQPSGATGFGQEFSALHVNNWGKTVADEIILGTKTFLKEHPQANAEKVGCIGASYGGFMTMLLTTRTDLFAAAIEHAGISSISSYWGEGYWGYLYSSVASANSFPWNNKSLYIDQSPLFRADKINTPLLLLHGKADTNVPVGESIQMFTALKLLGRPVELVEIEGQDHHITDYKKRILWQKTILAWFDRWLKDQKEWWNYLYPPENL